MFEGADEAKTDSVPVVNPEFIKLSVNINQETAKALKKWSAIDDETLTEEIRMMVSVYDFIRQEILEGRVLVMENQDGGKRREIIIHAAKKQKNRK